MASPEIGRPRVYLGNECPLIYPGEQASAFVGHAAMAHAIEHALREAVDSGQAAIQPDGWLVEPMPGLHGWYLRARYRLSQWWLGLEGL